jgi:hypothetical protein
MKHDMRITVPIMADELPDIEQMLTEMSALSGNRPGQALLLVKTIITQYPLAIDIDNKPVLGVERTSFDRALLIVNAAEVAFQDHHLDWLGSGENATIISLLRWAVCNHNWSIEMKRF